MLFFSLPLFSVLLLGHLRTASAQPPARGSLVEDRAAKKLIAAGDARFDAEEVAKAVEIWQSVIERYPRSKIRFDAHMRLGNYFLERDHAYDQARVQYEAATSEENGNDAQRSESTLKMGVCFYHLRNYGKCFQLMRGVIEAFPTSPEVNQAYYYIGLGHFQLAHYSRAIVALERVGTTLSSSTSDGNKLEAGKRFFIKIEDTDLAVLDPEQGVPVRCVSSGGDTEIIECFSVGRNVRLVLGSIASRLGVPRPDNGTLEIKGGDTVQVTYLDEHTADKTLNRPVVANVTVVGDGVVAITDGAFEETLNGVVLGKTINLRISDPDLDVSDNPDKLTAIIEVHRLKTDDELEDEMIAAGTSDLQEAGTEGETNVIDRYKRVDRVEITLTEAILTERQRGVTVDEQTQPDPAGPNTELTNAVDPAVHSGVFHGGVPLIKVEQPEPQDSQLQAMPGDQIRLIYTDRSNSAGVSQELTAKARCLEGNIGGVRVTRADISDHELRVQTQLKTASAMTKIGNRYKEFGLKTKAHEKYDSALAVCEEIMIDARRLGGRLLEETYVQFWHIYFEMERLELAASMCQRLQREFPNSAFVDDALLQLGEVAREQQDFRRAIGIYTRLVNMEDSLLRGEAQFGIAEAYENMAEQGNEGGRTALMERAFQEYKKVFDHFPDSGRVGESVAKMAEHYYEREDYERALDTFENVLDNHPDAKFLDVILFNYGRCLYRMDRKPEARRRFDQLIGDFPESPLATDAKQISDTLLRAGF
ncbi:MAG: tetratricopeptide repeat protein [Rubripirellula sp.]|nr:tetratricopeptide repeat protein [Rubripirellula sp.]